MFSSLIYNHNDNDNELTFLLTNTVITIYK